MAKTVASKTRVIPVNDYAVGVYDVPVQNIANNVTGYTLSILRCTSADPTIWPDPGSIIRVEIMFSFDNGQTFVEGGAFEAFGGIHIRRDGSEGQTSEALFEVPTGTQRKLKATITLIPDPNLNNPTIKTGADFITYRG